MGEKDGVGILLVVGDAFKAELTRQVLSGEPSHEIKYKMKMIFSSLIPSKDNDHE